MEQELRVEEATAQEVRERIREGGYAGPTSGLASGFVRPMVVSMRPFRPEEVPLTVRVTGRYPSMHGAPVHVGDPAALGIKDLDEPEFGDPVALEEGQMPVFWACGVTPQAVIMQAKPPLVITHSPGHMFVTDRRHSEYEV